VSQYFGVDWAAMCLTFAAIYLLGSRRRGGFLVMMIGNLCWSCIGLWAHSYAMVIANLGFFSMNVRGFLKWARPSNSE
jgi:Nicotinamide mononucleotide transporter